MTQSLSASSVLPLCVVLQFTFYTVRWDLQVNILRTHLGSVHISRHTFFSGLFGTRSTPWHCYTVLQVDTRLLTRVSQMGRIPTTSKKCYVICEYAHLTFKRRLMLNNTTIQFGFAIWLLNLRQSSLRDTLEEEKLVENFLKVIKSEDLFAFLYDPLPVPDIKESCAISKLITSRYNNKALFMNRCEPIKSYK